MKKRIPAAILGAVLASCGAGAALAHHSFGAEFDQNNPVVLDGVVTKFDWENPHSRIHLDVVDPKTGQHQHWRIEGGSPLALLRRGWNRDSLPPGTRIHVVGFRAWDDDTRASAAEISFPNGTRMSLGYPPAEKAQADLARRPPQDQ
jgi:hypothetical protein